MIGGKYIDLDDVLDTEVVYGRPIRLSMDESEGFSFQVLVNSTGTTADLEGAFSVEVSNDPRVMEDLLNGVVTLGRFTAPATITETAHWTTLSSGVTVPTMDDGSLVDTLINVSSLRVDWVRLLFTGSGGTDSDMKVWTASF